MIGGSAALMDFTNAENVKRTKWATCLVRVMEYEHRPRTYGPVQPSAD